MGVGAGLAVIKFDNQCLYRKIEAIALKHKYGLDIKNPDTNKVYTAILTENLHLAYWDQLHYEARAIVEYSDNQSLIVFFNPYDSETRSELKPGTRIRFILAYLNKEGEGNVIFPFHIPN